MCGNQLGKEGSFPLIQARKLYPLCKPKRAGKQELLPALNTETHQNITGALSQGTGQGFGNSGG